MEYSTLIDKKFKTDTFVIYLSQAGVVLCGFAYTTVVTKYAGISIFGMLGILTAFSSVLTNLLTFRTNEAIVVFYKRGESLGDLGLCKFALLTGIVLDIVVGCGLLALVYHAAGLIAQYLLRDPYSESAVRLFAFTLFFQFFRGAPSGYLIARERFLGINILILSEHVIKIGLLAVMLYQGGELDLNAIVTAGMLAAMVASLAVYSYLLLSLIRRYAGIRTTLNRSLLKEYLGFSLNTFLSTALKAGNQNIDTLVLGLVTDNRLVGIYALFRQFLAPLAFLSNPFATLAYPKFVQAVVERRVEDIRKLILEVNIKLLKSYVVLLLIIVPAIFVYDKWVRLEVIPTEYVTFLFMIFSMILSGLVWWGRPFANAIEPGFSLKMNLFATIFILTFIYPAALHLSILGVSLVMFSVNFMLNIFWRHRLSIA